MTSIESERPQEASQESAALRSRSLQRFADAPPEFVLVFALLVLGSIFWQGSPYFITVPNIRNLLMSVAVLGLMAVPGTFLLISGNFDLAVASTAALSAVTVAMTATEHGAFLGILAALGLGLAVGAVNGFLSMYCGIASIIVTLGTMQVVRGVALMISGGMSHRMDREIDFLTDRVFGVPIQIVLFLFVFGLGVFVSRYTRFGRSIFAIGSNPAAARLAGIREKPSLFVMFCFSGVLAALGGLVIASQLNAANPNTATGLELQVVAAVLLGGASLKGGRGTIHGTLLGLLILGVLQNGLTLLSISAFWRVIATGTVLIAAVGLDQVRIRVSGTE